MRGALFIHGPSLADNDQHILDTIASKKSKITDLYIGLFGDSRRPEARGDNGGRKLLVHFYEAGSANVWGRPPLSSTA